MEHTHAPIIGNSPIGPLLKACGLDFWLQHYVVAMAYVPQVGTVAAPVPVTLFQGGHCHIASRPERDLCIQNMRVKLERHCSRIFPADSWPPLHQVFHASDDVYVWWSGERFGSDGLHVNGRVMFGIIGNRSGNFGEVANLALYRLHLFYAIGEAMHSSLSA